MDPLCAEIIVLQMDSPIPIPLRPSAAVLAVEEELSKIVGRRYGGMPTP